MKGHVDVVSRVLVSDWACGANDEEVRVEPTCSVGRPRPRWWLSVRLRTLSDLTSTNLRTDTRQHGCNERCALDLGDRGSPASCAGQCPGRPGSSRRSGGACAARLAQLRLLASDPHDVIHRLAGQLLPAARTRTARADCPSAVGEVALDGAQLIAGDRVLDAQAALEASDPQPRPLDIELVAPHLDGLADPQAVPIDHQQTGRGRECRGAPSLPPRAGDRSPDRSENPSSARESRSFPISLFTFRLLVAMAASTKRKK